MLIFYYQNWTTIDVWIKSYVQVGDKYFVKVFPGGEHGFTTRYDLEDEAAHHRACEAHDELLLWFGKYLS